MYNPLEQFELTVIQIIYFFELFDLSITNVVVLIMFIFCIIYFIGYSLVFRRNRRKTIIPNNWQNFLEVIYLFLLNLTLEQTSNRGLKYFPFLFTLFWFVFLSNLLGLIPFGFTITSHIIITFSLSIGIIIGFTIIGFVNYKLKFIKLFIPSGAPNAILPLLIIIEILSYSIRVFSLAIRLSANMMAGHTLLYIVSGFVIKLKKLSIIIFLISWVLILAILLLEIGISILQAYVFVTLCSIYLNDVLANPEIH